MPDQDRLTDEQLQHYTAPENADSYSEYTKECAAECIRLRNDNQSVREQLHHVGGLLFERNRQLAAAAAFIEHIRNGGECVTKWTTIDAHLDVCESCRLLNNYDTARLKPEESDV